MALVRRPPESGFFAEDDGRSGLFEKTDGTIWLRDSNGNEAQVEAGGAGGSFVRLTLRHSAAFANVVGNAPVVERGLLDATAEGTLALPPSLLGNDSIIDLLAENPTDADVDVNCTLVVQSGDGTVWIEQDSEFQTIPAGATESVDLANNFGSAGVGLSWNATTKQVDIANAGLWSAFATVWATPTPS